MGFGPNQRLASLLKRKNQALNSPFKLPVAVSPPGGTTVPNKLPDSPTSVQQTNPFGFKKLKNKLKGF